MKYARRRYRAPSRSWQREIVERDVAEAERVADDLEQVQCVFGYCGVSRMRASTVANLVFGSQGYAIDRERAVLRERWQTVSRIAREHAGKLQGLLD